MWWDIGSCSPEEEISQPGFSAGLLMPSQMTSEIQAEFLVSLWDQQSCEEVLQAGMCRRHKWWMRKRRKAFRMGQKQIVILKSKFQGKCLLVFVTQSPVQGEVRKCEVWKTNSISENCLGQLTGFNVFCFFNNLLKVQATVRIQAAIRGY